MASMSELYTEIDGLDDEALRRVEHYARRLIARRSARAAVTFKPGDRVRMVVTVRPAKLALAPGTVMGWSGRRVVVDLDYAVARYHRGLRCEPSLIERIPWMPRVATLADVTGESAE